MNSRAVGRGLQKNLGPTVFAGNHALAHKLLLTAAIGAFIALELRGIS
jgi:hypothetical protein